MPSVYDLKPRFQGLLRPLIGRLARAGVTPNAVTLAAVVGSVAVGGLVGLARERPTLLLLLPVWLFLRMALNAIDGLFSGLGDITPEVRRSRVGPKCKCPVPPK